MSGYITRQQHLETVRERVAKRIKRKLALTHTVKHDAPPLPMSDRFWKEVDLLHVRAERFGTFRRSG